METELDGQKESLCGRSRDRAGVGARLLTRDNNFVKVFYLSMSLFISDKVE